MATVKVFTPNFKHITVKISQNMTLLQILEEASLKAELNASEHDLKHHRTILDLSQMFRFSGLPSNCDLEMVVAKVIRKDIEDNAVVIVVQTETQGRLEGTFKPGSTLMEIILKLCPEESSAETNPVIIYMRTDVQAEKLATTTLKSLGLTSGRGLLRLIHKSAEELKTQANVSGPLPQRPLVVSPSSSSSNEGAAPPTVKSEFKKETNILKQLKNNESKPDPIEEPTAGPSHNASTSETEPIASDNVVPVPLEKKMEAPSAKRNIEYTKEDLERLETETKRLDDSNTVIYSLESVVNSSFEDIPDSFFDVTISDVRVLMSQLKDVTRSMDNAPLMTSKLRELEDAKRTLSQLKYRETLIRVQFPNRLVLQTVFKPIDTIGRVKEFLGRFLVAEVEEFELFTTPPKTILNDEDRLVELHFVPQALIHFTSTGQSQTSNVIREEFLNQLSTAEAAAFLAAKIRGRIEMIYNNNNNVETVPNLSSSTETPMEVTQMESEAADEPKKRIVGTFKVSSTVTTEKGALPKWFKTAK